MLKKWNSDDQQKISHSGRYQLKTPDKTVNHTGLIIFAGCQQTWQFKKHHIRHSQPDKDYT